jgi:hypothetical protein
MRAKCVLCRVPTIDDTCRCWTLVDSCVRCTHSAWSELHIIRQGQVINAAAATFPRTTALLRRVSRLIAIAEGGTDSGVVDNDYNYNYDHDHDDDDDDDGMTNSIAGSSSSDSDTAATTTTTTTSSSSISSTAGIMRGRNDTTPPHLRGIINARFSRLAAGTHISAHCGVSNAKLRAHVGIRVPLPLRDDDSSSPPLAQDTAAAAAAMTTTTIKTTTTTTTTTTAMRSGMVVGGVAVEWGEGRLLVFDDSFEHEVWWRWTPTTPPAPGGDGNGGDEGDNDYDDNNDNNGNNDNDHMGGDDSRVVLIVDVFHPQVAPSLRARLRATF